MVVKGSFEDFIYILAGLVWVAFSIYKGSQKQKKKNATTTKENKSKSTIEGFIGELLGVKEEEVVYQEERLDSENENVLFDETEKTETHVESYPSKVFSYDDKYEEDNLFEEKTVYTPKDSVVSAIKKTKERKPIRKRKKPRFDVRKAVIYSEILKRPTY